MSVEELESVKRQAQALKPEEKSELANYLLGQENEQERIQSALRNDRGKTIRQGNRLVTLALVTLFLWIVTLSIILYARRPSYLEFPSVNIGQDQSVVDQQLTLMQAEIKVMRDYNDDFLSTIHWSLYTVLIVASLLIGANLLSSFRIADRERESLKQELHNLLQADISAVRMELQQGSFAMLSDIVTRLGRSDYEIKSLRQDFLYLSEDIAHSRAGQYLAQGDDQAAIAEYGKLLSIAIERGSDYSMLLSLLSRY